MRASKDDNDKQYHYISSPYGLVAIYIKQGSVENMHYVTKDHIGSIIGLVAANGTVEQEYNYDAWGRRRNPSTWAYYTSTPTDLLIDRGYTQHEHLDQFTLINMNGRVYDPTVGRMLSPDIFIQSPENSQSYNRYSYCFNNPLKYTDPNGCFSIPGFGPFRGFIHNLFTAIKMMFGSTSTDMEEQGRLIQQLLNTPAAGGSADGAGGNGGNGGSGTSGRSSSNSNGPAINYTNTGNPESPWFGDVSNVDVVATRGRYNGEAWFYSNFIGPGPDINPLRIPSLENPNNYLKPLSLADRMAQLHDCYYYIHGADGIRSALFDRSLVAGDAALAFRSYMIVAAYNYNCGYDEYTKSRISWNTAFQAYLVGTAFLLITITKL